MTLAEVTEIVGEPRAHAISDGPWRSWYTTYYSGPSMEGVYLMFDDVPGAPIESFKLDRYGLEHPFDGQTERGIGIGSTLSETIRQYGDRDGFIGNWQLYCVEKSVFQFLIEADTVARINVGFYQPLPQLIDCS